MLEFLKFVGVVCGALAAVGISYFAYRWAEGGKVRPRTDTPAPMPWEWEKCIQSVGFTAFMALGAGAMINATRPTVFVATAVLTAVNLGLMLGLGDGFGDHINWKTESASLIYFGVSVLAAAYFFVTCYRAMWHPEESSSSVVEGATLYLGLNMVALVCARVWLGRRLETLA